MKWLIPASVITVGICIFVGGLLYGVLTVGVPTPDAPHPVAAQENRDVGRAGIAMAAGLALSALGVVGSAALAITRIARRRSSGAEPLSGLPGLE
jgi:hypothetical protein